MADDVSLIVSVDYKEMTGFIKTSGQTKRVLKEIGKEFSKTGDHSRWMSSINAVVKADHKLAESARLGQKEIMKLGYEMRNEAKFADALTTATKRLTAAQTTSNKVMGQTKNKMNGNNMAIQQLGYQVGDFAVQVQGGTSAFVAFSQQGAQLAGMLPMIAGPLGLTMGAAVGLSAALGILIPIGSAVGRMFFEMKDSAKDAAKEAETLDDKLKSLKSTLKDYANTLAAMQSGVSLDKLFATRGIDKAKKDLVEAEKALASIIRQQQASLMLSGRVSGGAASRAEEKRLLAVKALTAAKKVLADLEAKEAANRAENSQKSFIALNQELVLLGTKKKYGEDSPQAVNKELEQELRNREAAIDARVRANELDAASGQVLKRLARHAAAQSVQIRINTELEKNRLNSIKLYYSNLQKITKLQKDRAEAVKKIRDAVDAEKKSMGDTIALNQIILTHGKDSLQVKVEEAKQARDKYKLSLQNSKILGNDLIDAMNLYDINVGITDQQKRQAEYQKTINGLLAQNQVFVNSLNEAAVIARDKAAEQVELITNLEEKYGESVVTALALAGVDITSPISSAADEAARLAKELGVALEVAADVLLEQRSLEQTPMYKYGGRSTTDSRKPTMDGKTLPKIKKAKKTKGGGGNVIDINEIIEARKLQIAQDRVLIGLSGEQHEAQKIYYELLKENEKADVQVTETKLKNSADYIAAKLEENRVLEEAKAQQDNLAKSISSSMGDAFTSIVDGTKSVKDAFKDMARSIIKQLFEIFVVKKITGFLEKSIGGLFGGASANGGGASANGNVFSGGSRVQAYANGGVVGSPTTFPMAGGKIGLMGEAGPEAIMPLKRGANGKLGVQMEGGGGGNVVIHQNFNFQANGDESVKKLIAQAAPQIANMTKSSMLNDRRRGGTTKAVFG